MGRSAIIYVLGLGFILGYTLLNMNSAGTDAVSNMSIYYVRTVSHEIAESGANIGCSDVFLDSTSVTPYSGIDYQGGQFGVRFFQNGASMFVTSIGHYNAGPFSASDTIVAELRNQSLARYAWFTNMEADRFGFVTSWSTGDSAWGPVHTNDKFNISGSPVFMKKATAYASAVPTVNNAVWNGGYEWGIKIPYPTNLNSFISAARDSSPTGGRYIQGLGNNDTTYLVFNTDGTVDVTAPLHGIDTTFPSTSALTPNGAFAVIGGNLDVQGTVSGNLAVGAVTDPLGRGGYVSITDNILYAHDPTIDPTSTDKLGVYATFDITVAYDGSQPISKYTNRKVNASIFTLKGMFQVDQAKNGPIRGQLSTFGAMMQYYRGQIGKVVGGTLQAGYSKYFQYDQRLTLSPPLYFPSAGRYTLFAWKEGI